MKATIRPTDNFDVIEFKDLKFREHPMGFGGIQSIVQFSNGYGASVVKTPTTYGGSQGLYELAVFGVDGHISYNTPITDDVLGYLNESDVSDVLLRISKL